LQHILVTGANGFVGNAFCRRILNEGWKVRGVIRAASSKALLPPEIETVTINSIGPSTEWEAALEDIDTVVHLAARVHIRDDNPVDSIVDYRRINVAGTSRLAQMAVSKKIRRFVYISSIKVNGEGKSTPYTAQDRPAPVDPYGLSKLEAEQELISLADKSGLDLVILRPPLAYGPGVKANFLQLIKLIDRGIPLPLARVANCRSFIFLGNLVDALMACAVHPGAAGKTFLLSDGFDISTPELIQKISSALGKSSRLFPFPPDYLRFLGRIIGKHRTVNRLLDSLIVDMSKIQSELDWNPPFSMEEGLQETVNWYQQALR
jgi:nucleoside-diphosphate-sugar epimerase